MYEVLWATQKMPPLPHDTNVPMLEISQVTYPRGTAPSGKILLTRWPEEIHHVANTELPPLGCRSRMCLSCSFYAVSSGGLNHLLDGCFSKLGHVPCETW